jgi:hypothetical protein
MRHTLTMHKRPPGMAEGGVTFLDGTVRARNLGNCALRFSTSCVSAVVPLAAPSVTGYCRMP